MRYRRLDLNLLVALDALLEECNVSRAAERLHLGQSATSARWRGCANTSTTLAGAAGTAPGALGTGPRAGAQGARGAGADREIVDASVRFEPARCERRFTLVASDYVAACCCRRLAANWRGRRRG
jgi:LysR family nod box-dependent transcriptional activator